MRSTKMAESRLENSAQVSSCKLKFVHAPSYVPIPDDVSSSWNNWRFQKKSEDDFFEDFLLKLFREKKSENQLTDSTSRDQHSA